MFNRNPKIRTEIITMTGRILKKKLPYRQHKVIVKEARKGRGGAGYQPSFNKLCILEEDKGFWPFKKTDKKLVLIDGAEKCIEFHLDPKKTTIDIPRYDRESAEKLFEASTIKNAGMTGSKIQIPTAFYVLSILPTILIFIVLLAVTGKIAI